MKTVDKTIVELLDQAVYNMQLYLCSVGAHEGNLATLHRLEDTRTAVIASFEFDEAMAVDPVIVGAIDSGAKI